MFNIGRISRIPRMASCTAFLLVFSAGSMAFAQTAPQILPSINSVIAGGGTTNPAVHGLCPTSGYTATDTYGDGCLATEVLLGGGASTPGPRDAVADAQGNVYFGDYQNGLVHRIDAGTGVMTLVAGGVATSPTAGATCGTSASTDGRGDGCLGTFVHLSHPTGLVLDTSGNLYIADYGYGEVRKITGVNSAVGSVSISNGGSGYVTAPTVTFSAPAAGGTTATGTAVLSGGSVVSVTIVTPGSGYTAPPTVTFSAAPAGGVTATGTAASTGAISLIAGSPTSTGYNISTNTTTVTAAQSQLAGPYALALDNLGDLFIADEYDASIDVLNLNSTGSNTVNNTVVPAGTIWKIAGTVGTSGTSGSPYCTAGTGCTYNHTSYTEGIQANTDWLYNAYGLSVDSTGNVYTTNEYLDTIVKIAPSGLLTTYVGVQNSNGKSLTRGVAPNVLIGSPFGVATDALNNLYFTDAADGAIWRVDATSHNQYVIASGFGFSGTGFASTKLPGPGVFGISVDSSENLYFGDTENNNIREIASGLQFGVIGANQPTNTLVFHFASGDLPAAANAYTLTSGAGNFTLGTPTCNPTNSDGTTDCKLPVTATPTVLGPFTGTLTVTAQIGGSATFALSGVYAQSPVTRTSLTYAAGVTCSGTTTYSTTTPITLKATLIANGPNPPVGPTDNITFYNTVGGVKTAIATVPVSNLGTATSPVYGATTTYTFSTVGTYTLTAVYSGDSYFKTSTGTSPSTITSSTPGYTITPVTYMQSTVAQGQTALYSFTVNQNVFTGTINFAVTGLPAGATAVMSPSSLTGSGCTSTSTVALSIVTTPVTAKGIASIGGNGHGPWSMIAMFAGLTLAFFIGIRGRRVGKRFAQIGMALALLIATSGLMACNSYTINAPAPTPLGTYTLTVTATGSVGGTSAITFPLTVN